MPADPVSVLTLVRQHFHEGNTAAIKHTHETNEEIRVVGHQGEYSGATQQALRVQLYLAHGQDFYTATQIAKIQKVSAELNRRQ